jgi:hypothetical protein
MLTIIKINEQLGSWRGSIGKYFKVLTFCTAVGRQGFENAVSSLNIECKIYIYLWCGFFSHKAIASLVTKHKYGK